jgi:FAD/FMN-containing dehydrogenase
MFEYIKGLRGSISSEHGLGLNKAKYINYAKSDKVIEYMKLVKKMFDPKGIMNPYKVLSE